MVLGAFAARYSLLGFFDFVTWDGSYYINYLRDRTWQWVLHPGYPLGIEVARLFTDDGVFAAQLVSLVSGSLLVIPLYYLARSFLTPWYAVGATVIGVFNPWMVRYGAVTMSESFYILLAVTSLCLYFQKRYLLAGIAGGLAYLTRPEALVFIGIIGLFELIKRRYRPALELGLSCLVLAAPYIIYLHSETGQWSVTPKTMNIRVWDSDWRVNIAKETLHQEETPQSEVISAAVKAYPGRFAGFGERLWLCTGIPLLLAGLYGAVRKPSILAAGLAMFFLLPFFGVNILDRLVLPFIPILAVFALAGLSTIPWAWARTAIFILICLGSYRTLGPALEPAERLPELKQAGLALRRTISPDDILMDRKPYTALYAGGRFLNIPNEPPDTILQYMKEMNVRYLVLAERVIGIFRPQLNPYIYDEDLLARSGMKTVYVAGLRSGYGVRVVELPGGGG